MQRPSMLLHFTSQFMVSARSFIQILTATKRLGRTGASRQVDKVRAAMLRVLQAHGGHGVQRVEQKVLFAVDMESLWYLRQDILQAITVLDGEFTARRHLIPIDRMFKGWLPNAMEPRDHLRKSA